MKIIEKEELFESFEKTQWNYIAVAKKYDVYPIEIYYQAKKYGLYDIIFDKEIEAKIIEEYKTTDNAMLISKKLGISIYRVNIILHKNGLKRIKWTDNERELITRYFNKIPYRDMENLLPGRRKTSVYHYIERNSIPFSALKPDLHEKKYVKDNPNCTVKDIQDKFNRTYEEAFIIKYFHSGKE